MGIGADYQTAVVCLDEPTRGMDRRRKDDLAALLRELDAAVVVATHDPEFVAAFAGRVVLLGEGTVIADGSPAEILAGGTYFATETARILGGAGGALVSEQGVALVTGSTGSAGSDRRIDRAEGGGEGMSWQLGAFAILTVALAGGFAWYERVHPDARIVALVGTLAAFAALGRIAFAAFPNVKPTTDIVLISGYALGGGPGFAVGALAGLASNFFFGQGPWTPWQMAGWGAAGVLGAGLAVVTHRRIGRWPLAIVCAVVGFGFTALQDVGDWVTYSDHSLAQLGVYVGKGIGFDFVHAAGCVVFALAFGPALIHSLTRFRTRLNVTWGTAAPLLVIALVAASLAARPGLVGVGRAAAASTPAGYLLAAQNADGGIGPAPGSASSALYSGWAALGLAAAGENPQDVVRDGHSLIGYIERGVASASDPGDVERNILVAGAAGLPATSFGGRDLVAELRTDIGRNGSVNNQTNWTSFAVLALRAAGVAPPPATLAWLVRQQDADGGFNFATRGGLSDVDDTGSALEALAGVSGSAAARDRARAIQYLRRQQDRDGGFPGEPGRRLERTVDGVRRPGAAGGGRQPELDPPRRRAVPARLPAFADRHRRARPLLAGERRDADLGHGRGADGARGQAAPGGAPGAPKRARPRSPPAPPHDRAVRGQAGAGTPCRAPLGAPPAAAAGSRRDPAAGGRRRRPARGRRRHPDRAQPGVRRRDLIPPQEKIGTLRRPHADRSPQGDCRGRAARRARARGGAQAVRWR